jgi:hypothetical protein
MATSNSDILTAAKNIAAALSVCATAINDSTANATALAGSKSKIDITTDTLVQAGKGRIAKVIVVVAGTTLGSIHDAKTVAAAGANNRLLPLPNTVGQFDVGFPVNDGIVIKPGTGQTVAISYS